MDRQNISLSRRMSLGNLGSSTLPTCEREKKISCPIVFDFRSIVVAIGATIGSEVDIGSEQFLSSNLNAMKLMMSVTYFDRDWSPVTVALVSKHSQIWTAQCHYYSAIFIPVSSSIWLHKACDIDLDFCALLIMLKVELHRVSTSNVGRVTWKTSNEIYTVPNVSRRFTEQQSEYIRFRTASVWLRINRKAFSNRNLHSMRYAPYIQLV